MLSLTFPTCSPQNYTSFKDTHKYSFQDQVLSQLHLRPVLKRLAQSSPPPLSRNTSLGLSPILLGSSLRLGHRGLWVPGWDAQIYHTEDRNSRDVIQGSCHRCLVILQLATRTWVWKISPSDESKHQFKGRPTVSTTRQEWCNDSDRKRFPFYKIL